MNGYRRKRSPSNNDDGGKVAQMLTTFKDYQDDATQQQQQQPAAKCIKIFNGGLVAKEHIATKNGLQQASVTGTTTPATSLQLSQVVGGGSLVVSPSFFNAVTNATVAATAGIGSLRTQKIVMNGGNVGSSAQQQNVPVLKNIILNSTTNSATSNELGRLPGGAELNILPSNGAKLNGYGNGSAAASTATATTTAAFYHANGKLTLMNGGAAVGVSGNGGILLKDTSNVLGVNSSSAAITPIIVTTTSNATSNGIVNGSSGGLNAINASTNFAQLLAATSVAPQNLATVKSVSAIERLNGKTYNWNRAGTTTN